MPKTVVVLSGGLDSLVTLATALKGKHRKKDIFVFRVDTRSRQSAKESHAFRLIADHYGIPEENACEAELQMPSWSSNDLFDPYVVSLNIDDNTKEFFHNAKGNFNNSIVVPVRNAIFLSMAFSYALSVEASTIWLGFDYVDKPGLLYNAPPDKSPKFVALMLKALNEAAGKGSSVSVVVTPLQGNDKQQIVKKGHDLKAPFELSWSCYNGLLLSCGLCPACRSRIQGFEANGLKDPLTYHEKAEVLKYYRNPIP